MRSAVSVHPRMSKMPCKRVVDTSSPRYRPEENYVCRMCTFVRAHPSSLCLSPTTLSICSIRETHLRHTDSLEVRWLGHLYPCHRGHVGITSVHGATWWAGVTKAAGIACFGGVPPPRALPVTPLKRKLPADYLARCAGRVRLVLGLTR